MIAKRWLAGRMTMLMLAVLLLMVGQAQAANYFFTQVVDEREVPIASGIQCAVYTAGTETLATIYTTQTLATAAANPLTGDSSGVCSWWQADSTAVDLVVWHKRGRVLYQAFSVHVHRLVLNTQIPGKALAVRFTKQATEFSTGVTVPKGSHVRGVVIKDDTTVGVSTAVGSPYPWIRIGLLSTETGGNARGFCGSGVTKVGDDSTGGRTLGQGNGWLGCHAVVTSATHPALDFFYSAFHSGTLVSRGAIGKSTSDATAGAHAGSYTYYGYRGDGVAKTVSYTTSNDNAVAGWFYVLYDELGSASN
jgi:hypothetical protein